VTRWQARGDQDERSRPGRICKHSHHGFYSGGVISILGGSAMLFFPLSAANSRGLKPDCMEIYQSSLSAVKKLTRRCVLLPTLAL
jgi:hypothetical protein